MACIGYSLGSLAMKPLSLFLADFIWHWDLIGVVEYIRLVVLGFNHLALYMFFFYHIFM